MFDVSRLRPVRRLALGAVFVCAAAAPALAQDAGRGQDPSWLERRVDGLERGLAFFGRGEERPAEPRSSVRPAQSSMADIAVRLDRLENQMRQMNGRLEEMQFQVRRNDEALKRFQGDVDFRLQDLESGKGGGGSGGARPSRRGEAASDAGGSSTAGLGRGGDAGPGAPPSTLGGGRGDAIGGLIEEGPGDDPDGPMSIRPPGVGQNQGYGSGQRSGGGQSAGPDPDARMAARGGGDLGSTTAAGGSPRDQFDLGVGFVQRRDYDQAESTFRDFLRAHPDDAKAPEARYWLGESLYQRRKYTDAADSFLTIYKDAPQSAKAPESMLKLGMSLNGMGKKEEACATIAEAGKKYSHIKAQSDRELKRISC